MSPVDHIEQGEAEGEEVPGDAVVAAHVVVQDPRVFESLPHLAQLSILETELKDLPVSRAAFSLSFLGDREIS